MKTQSVFWQPALQRPGDIVEGTADIMLFIRPWTQFFDLKGEARPKKGLANNITIKKE